MLLYGHMPMSGKQHIVCLPTFLPNKLDEAQFKNLSLEWGECSLSRPELIVCLFPDNSLLVPSFLPASYLQAPGSATG